MWASYKGHTDTVVLLLDRGADCNAHGNFHISSLLWAAGRGHTRIVSELVVRSAKVNVGDKYGTTALVWASRKGFSEIVDILLKAGANVDTAGKNLTFIKHLLFESKIYFPKILVPILLMV